MCISNNMSYGQSISNQSFNSFRYRHDKKLESDLYVVHAILEMPPRFIGQYNITKPIFN